VKIHIVQKGDTLWKLAKKYGVNFEELKKLNSQLSNPDMIMPGMKIKIPGTDTAGKKETVTKAETKVSFGSKKEAPKAVAEAKKEKPVKEAPITAPKAKEAPIKVEPKAAPIKVEPKAAPIKVEPKAAPIKIEPKAAPIKVEPKAAPIKVEHKIAPMPIVKEELKQPVISKQKAPKMPQPVISDIDMNHYYMMNMANLQVPAPKPIQPVMPEKPMLPIVMKDESPESPESPVQQLPAQECVPVTPLMPGTGFCPPFHPWAYPQVHGSMVAPMPMMEESSSCMAYPAQGFYPYSHMNVMQQAQPMMQGMMQPQPAYTYPHAYMGQVQGVQAMESSSIGEPSSSQMYHMGYGQQPPSMMSMGAHMGVPYQAPAAKEQDCGCDAGELPKSPKSMMPGTDQQMVSPIPMPYGQQMNAPLYYQKQAVPSQYMQEHMGGPNMSSMQNVPKQHLHMYNGTNGYQQPMQPSSQQPYQPMSPGQTQSMGQGPMQQMMWQGQMQPMGQGQMQPMGQGQMQPMGQGQMQPMGQGQMQPMGQGPMQPMGQGQMHPMGQGPMQPMGQGQMQPMDSSMMQQMYQMPMFPQRQIQHPYGLPPMQQPFNMPVNGDPQSQGNLETFQMPRFADESSEQ
jgi:spore coat assembly protein SafA